MSRADTTHGANGPSDHVQPGKEEGHHQQPQQPQRACPNGLDPASALQPPHLLAIDQREYDSTARAGKVSYSPLGPGASRAELEAELSRLRGRLEGVRADMAREAYRQLTGERAGRILYMRHPLTRISWASQSLAIDQLFLRRCRTTRVFVA